MRDLKNTPQMIVALSLLWWSMAAASAAPATRPNEDQKNPTSAHTASTPMNPEFDQLYVSPTGKDSWTGKLGEVNADKTDGPLATLGAARNAIREMKRSGKLARPVIVFLRGGRYPLAEPLVFGPDDSAPVTYAAFPGETPILDGGRLIENWRQEQVNNKTCWVADLPEVAAGTWYFRELFVDGQPRPRTRLPREGYHRIAEIPGQEWTKLRGWGKAATRQFRCAAGEISKWKNLSDVDIVALHYWIEERMPIASFDPETNLVTVSRTPVTALADDWKAQGARYYVENVFEALSEPGEWYLDRPGGKLYYLPKAGEEIGKTQLVAPVSKQLLKLVGKAESNQYVEFLRFQGLTFQHTDWAQMDDGMAAANQAAWNVPGVIYLEGAKNCSIEDCRIRGIGWYGVELADGCQGNRIVGNEVADMGAGGVKINGSDAAGPLYARTGNNRITDNHIHAGGRIFRSAVGVLSRHSFGNTIAHNHIHDLFYTGISVGWVWGYRESVSCDNLIEKNHIHDIGQAVLSDMGGIYTLGVQPGTVIRGNLIHDITKDGYGGWAIYPDEGSSHEIIENNVCYRTNDQVFHQHYGRENIVRNNIFAFGDSTVARYSRVEEHVGFTFERNILLSDGRPFFMGDYGPKGRRMLSDLNLYWDTAGKNLFTDKKGPNKETIYLDLAAWQAQGHDQHSVVADPLLADPRHGDFTLSADSPALKLGFHPIDLSDVGPRPPKDRE